MCILLVQSGKENIKCQKYSSAKLCSQNHSAITNSDTYKQIQVAGQGTHPYPPTGVNIHVFPGYIHYSLENQKINEK